jgi:GNAT superfamily N-acetyltransferase
MEITFRPAIPDDFEAITDLINRANPWEPPISLEAFTFYVERADPARPRVHLVAEGDGRVVGHGFLRAGPVYEPLYLNLDVDPAGQRRGIGTQLLGRLVAGAVGDGRGMYTLVSEESASGLGFVRQHDFTEQFRLFESTVDLATFDPERFAASRRALTDAGVRFSNLAAEDSPALRRRIHALTDEVVADVPGPMTARPLTYEAWERDAIDAPMARLELIALAFVGDEPVALSGVTVEADGTGYNSLTGVARAHRGRKLGLAVKVEGLRLAKEFGLPSVRTDNHTDNAPMLAINSTLGFQPVPGFISFGRSLG